MPDELLEEYKERLAMNDFRGIANILGNNIHPKTFEKRQELYTTIKELQDKGDYINAILSSNETPLKVKNAIKFNLRRDSGVLGRNTTFYEKEYLDAINNIGNGKGYNGTNDDERADYLEYTFKTNDDYDYFVKQSGITPQQKNKDNQNSHYLYYNNGKPVLRVYKNTFNDGEFFDNITNGLEAVNDNGVTQFVKYFYPRYEKNSEPYEPTLEVRSYNSKGKQLRYHHHVDRFQRRAYRISKNARTTEDNFNEEFSKVVPVSLISSPYSCSMEQQLQEYYYNGMINQTDYTNAKKDMQAAFNDALKTFSLTNPRYQECYWIGKEGKKNGSLDQIADEDRYLADNIIRTAAQEGRITVRKGSAGGKVGTIITISNVADKKHDAVDFDHVYGRGTTIFVPGLFEEDAEKVMATVPEAKVMNDIAKRQAFHYDYTMYDGNRLTDFDSSGRAYLNGVNQLPPEDVQRRMLENTLVQRVIDNSRIYAKYDNYGYVSEGQTDLINGIAKSATNIVAELYGISNPDELKSTEVRNHIEKIFQAILNQLGINEEGKQIR